MSKKIALGMALGNSGEANEIPEESLSPEDQLDILKKKVEELTKAFHLLHSKVDKRPDEIDMGLPFIDEKQNIPVGTTLMSNSQRGGLRFLTVGADGYYVGSTRYDSLSAAAEAISGVRRSGWTFWKLTDGRTVKEVYKD